jgi:hypothetical protein
MTDINSKDLVIITSCYGQKFWSAVGGWLRNVREFNDISIEIISLDGGRYENKAMKIETILIEPKEIKLKYGAGDKYRMARILEKNRDGITCIQIDIDVILKRSISSLLDLPFDFIISRAFVFPANVAENMGFVGCTGFYISKPGALKFIKAMLARSGINSDSKPKALKFIKVMLTRLRIGSEVQFIDQLIINDMLLEAKNNGQWLPKNIILDDTKFDIDVFLLHECSVAVLPKNFILRSPDIEDSIYGNHHSAFIDKFRQTPDQKELHT